MNKKPLFSFVFAYARACARTGNENHAPRGARGAPLPRKRAAGLGMHDYFASSASFSYFALAFSSDLAKSSFALSGKDCARRA